MLSTFKLIEFIQKNIAGKSRGPTEREKQDSLELVKKLKEMDEAYKKATAPPKPDTSAIPVSLGLEPKTFTPKTDAEILEEAKTALAPSYEQKTQELEKDRDAAIEKLEGEADKELNRYEEQAKKLEESAAGLSEKHKRSMINQGIVNSSIFGEGLLDIEKALAESSLAAKTALENKLTEIEAKINLARLNFEEALYQYDLQYAASLEAKVNSLKTEQEKIKEQINAYNKKIAEQELKYALEREKKIKELEEESEKRRLEQEERQREEELRKGYSGEKAEEMERRYRLALETYGSLDKEVALNLINKQSEDLKATLGLYYQRLIEEIMSK